MHTSTVVHDTIEAQVHPYLDSEELHDWLQKFAPRMLGRVLQSMNSTAVIPLTQYRRGSGD